MTTYRREAILSILDDELQRAAVEPDAEHAKTLSKWESDELDRINAEHEAQRILTRVAGASSTAQILELVAPQQKGRYGSPRVDRFRDVLAAANAILPPKPERTPTSRERTIANVITLIKGSPQDTIAVADLRALGALPFVAIR